ncbi:response regulator [Pleurocapsa sp. CCALA 161]|uniref:response regulator n=1 Tax=Pleurocapsa sp. CCALA 161 TaxID=2107688 RepID=UPI000D0819F4|nr:response regulator [Pleurocapsa sp. CCALA 161]PSB06003.1 response regulator [Pleurocapsa sp. CCALA 161]
MHSNSDKIFNRSLEDYQPLILIVDNDNDNLLLASYIVESMGFDYVVTDDSEKCLSLAAELLPDIILLDIVMPKMNGLEIINLIKQDLSLAHISIIAVTGLTKAEDLDRLITAGFDDYLCKPYLIEELEGKIYSLLNYPLA